MEMPPNRRSIKGPIIILLLMACVIGVIVYFTTRSTATNTGDQSSTVSRELSHNITTTLEPIKEFFTASPIVLSKPQNLRLTDTEHGLNFTWSMVDDSKNWDFYEVIIRGDMDEESVIQPTSEDSVLIPEDLYCMVMSVGLRVIHQEQKGPVTFKAHHSPAVTGLTVKRSPKAEEEFIILWDPHPKEESCMLEYKIICRAEGKTTFSLRTPETSAVLKTEDCCGEIIVAGVDNNEIFTKVATISTPPCNNNSGMNSKIDLVENVMR